MVILCPVWVLVAYVIVTAVHDALMDDRALRVDRATRQQILTDADYKCQLQYQNVCTVTATELAHVGTLKAACKECRRHRETRRQMAGQMAAGRMRRTRP